MSPRIVSALVCLLLSPPLLLAAEKAAPAATPEPLGPGSAFQVLFALGFVLALIGAMAWLARRFGNMPGGVGGMGGAVRVLASQAVGQRERIVLVQVGETQLLLGVAPGRVETLHVLEKPLDLAAAGSVPHFADRFAAALKNRGKP